MTSSMRSRVSITRLSGPMIPRERALRRSATLLPDRSGGGAGAAAGLTARFFLAAALVFALVELFDRDAELLRLLVDPLDLRVAPPLRLPELPCDAIPLLLSLSQARGTMSWRRQRRQVRDRRAGCAVRRRTRPHAAPAGAAAGARR